MAATAGKEEAEEEVVQEIVTTGERSLCATRLKDLVAQSKKDVLSDPKSQFLGDLLLRAPDDLAIFDVLGLALVTGRRAGFGPLLNGGVPGKKLLAAVYDRFDADSEAAATAGGAEAASSSKAAQEELFSVSKMLGDSVIELFRAAESEMKMP